MDFYLTLGTGNIGGALYASAIIDEVIVENRAWSDAEVFNYYNQTNFFNLF